MSRGWNEIDVDLKRARAGLSKLENVDWAAVRERLRIGARQQHVQEVIEDIEAQDIGGQGIEMGVLVSALTTGKQLVVPTVGPLAGKEVSWDTSSMTGAFSLVVGKKLGLVQSGEVPALSTPSGDGEVPAMLQRVD